MDPEISRIQAEWRAQARRALEEAALELLDAAIRDAPLDPTPDEGTDEHPVRHLKDSGRIEIRETPGAIVAEVIFDGPYARKQHERLDYKHPHGGRAKYLEANLTTNRMLERLAAAERELLRR